MKHVKLHAAAKLSVLLYEKELKELSEGLEKHGLRVPIVLFGELALDNCSRQDAGRVANAEPWEDGANPTRAFVRDCCIVAPGRTVKGTDLFQAYQDWCRDSGRHTFGTAASFHRDVLAVGPGLIMRRHRVGHSAVRYYDGIGLRGREDVCGHKDGGTDRCPANESCVTALVESTQPMTANQGD